MKQQLLGKTIRLLLLEDDPEYSHFVRSALAELLEIRPVDNWLKQFEILDVESLEEALGCIEKIEFDAILADLFVLDSKGMNTAESLYSKCPLIPIVALIEQEDPNLTVKLLQSGVQDVLVKNELDCLPLGKAIRCAIERSMAVKTSWISTPRDSLTGLLNLPSIVEFGRSYFNLMRHCSEKSAVASFEIGSLENVKLDSGRHGEQWLLLEAAELLRRYSESFDLVAYGGNGRFIVMSPEQNSISLLNTLKIIEQALIDKDKVRGGRPLQISLSSADSREIDWSDLFRG